MKINFFVLFCASILLFNISFAQKENNVWATGAGVAIDFNSGVPVISNIPMKSLEACASVCDKSGNLLFYTNADTIWNKANVPMPNGKKISACGATWMPSYRGSSSCQGAVISPVINRPGIYYVFTVAEQECSARGTINYTLVDMSFDGGNGDVNTAFKSVVLDINKSERIALARGYCGTWLVTHHSDSPIVFAYKITEHGIVAPPIRSTYTGTSGVRKYYYGEIKLSNDFTKLALVNHLADSSIHLFDFDQRTGSLSRHFKIDSLGSTYYWFLSTEFSPDKSKLYVNNETLTWQFDLSLLPNVSLVRSSRYQVNTGSFTSFGRMRLAPDNKIYARGTGVNRFSRINFPNNVGATCGYEEDIASMNNTNLYFYRCIGNNSVSVIDVIDTKDTTITSSFDTLLCANTSILLSKVSGKTDFVWNTGDTTQNLLVSASGVYWRKSESGCTLFIDTFYVQMKAYDTTFNKHDTVVCFKKDASIIIQNSGYVSFLWSDGVVGKSNIFNKSETKWVISSNSNCEIAIDTFKVEFVNFELELRDTFFCNEPELTLSLPAIENLNYKWQDNSSANSFKIKDAGKYWVLGTVQNCQKTDTILVSKFELELGDNKSYCEGEQVILDCKIPDANYLWQDGTTTQIFDVKKSGFYYITVSKANCILTDSLLVNFVKCNNCIQIPNAFTPNSDSKNDIFKPIINCSAISYSLLIVNRYGQIIFQTNDQNQGWNGLFKNWEEEIGVYYYLIKVKFDYPNAVDELYKGDITLIR